MIAPIATAAAKSIAVHCDSVRRWEMRSPITAVAYISSALPTTPATCGVCPPSQSGTRLFVPAQRQAKTGCSKCATRVSRPRQATWQNW